MRNLAKKALPAAIGLAIGSLAVPAGAGNWFVGVGGGASSIDNFDSASTADVEALLAESGVAATVDRLDADDSDTGLRLFGGYQFNDSFALEGYYTDLGSFEVNVSGTIEDGGEGGSVPFAGEFAAEAQGFGVFAVVSVPLFGGLSALGKAGGIRWDVDVPATVNIDGSVASDSIGDDGTDFAWGGGLQYQITEHIAVDVQYEQFTTVDDIDLISGNARWQF